MVKNIKKIDYNKLFIKALRKAPQNIQFAVEKRISLFVHDSFCPQLHNHQLTGEYKGYRSINISGDWRALFTETMDSQGNRIITFHVLGTHSQLYR